MNGTVCPPVCPAASRVSTSRHCSRWHSDATRPAGSGRWKWTTSTLWARRAVDAALRQKWSMVAAAASRLPSPIRLSAYDR